MLRYWIPCVVPGASFLTEVMELGEDAKGVFAEFLRHYVDDHDLSPSISLSDAPLQARWLLGSRGVYYGVIYEGSDALGSRALGLRAFATKQYGKAPDTERAIALQRLRIWAEVSGIN